MLTDLLVVGELLADLISTDYVETLAEARQFNSYQGGSAANLCANLHWLGKKSKLVAAVGQDGIGLQLIDTLEKIGLNTDSIWRIKDHPTSLVVVGKSRATPEFIAYRHADCQIPILPETWIDQCRIIHTSAFALSLNPARTHLLNAIGYAREKGKLVSCDWNFAAPIWGQDNGQAVFDCLAHSNTLLKISLDDFARFSNNNQANVNEAIAFLSNYQFAACCLTAGADGVWWREGNGSWKHLKAQPVSQVVDTTGAGDAFWAGFLNQLLEDQPTEQAVLAGAMLAAQKIGQVGPLYTHAH